MHIFPLSVTKRKIAHGVHRSRTAGLVFITDTNYLPNLPNLSCGCRDHIRHV